MYTDHKPLKYILKSLMRIRKFQFGALRIAAYNCMIKYLQSKSICRLAISLESSQREEGEKPFEIDVY